MKRLLTAIWLMLGITVVHGQVLYTGGTYTQDFNGLISSGSSSWTDNSTLTGWYSSQTTYFAATGAAGAAELASFGTSTSDTNRALGDNFSTVTYGIRIQNNTGNTITGFTISYLGEQWSIGTGLVAADTLSVDYSIGATSLTVGTYTNLSTATFTAPTAPTLSGGNLNGELAANQATKNATVTALNVAPGNTLWVRWSHGTLLSLGQSLASDNFSFTATTAPEPGSFALLGTGLGLLGVGQAWRCRKFRAGTEAKTNRTGTRTAV